MNFVHVIYIVRATVRLRVFASSFPSFHAAQYGDRWDKDFLDPRDGNARVWRSTYRYHWQLEVDVDRYVIVYR